MIDEDFTLWWVVQKWVIPIWWQIQWVINENWKTLVATIWLICQSITNIR
jgi:phage-related protein